MCINYMYMYIHGGRISIHTCIYIYNIEYDVISDGQMRTLGPPAAPSVISAAPVTSRGTIINPRRACAARVTVVVLCVCLSTTILGLQATRRLMSDTNIFSATRVRKIN